MAKTALKPLVCPQCSGSVDLDKDQEFGFCKYCGTKVQNTAITKVKGKVKIDKSDDLENYLVLMRNAAKASNYQDEEKYSDMVLEIDSDNYEAWFCKGEAIGWQSQLRNNNLHEMISYFFKMVEALDDKKTSKEECEKYYNLSLESFYNVCYAIIELCTRDLSTDTLYDFTVQDIVSNYTIIGTCAANMEVINAKIEYNYDIVELYDTMVDTVRNSVFNNIINKINAYNRSSKDDQNQYALQSLAEEMDIAVQLFSSLYQFIRTKDALDKCHSSFKDFDSKVRIIPLCASYWNAMTSDYSYVTNYPFVNGVVKGNLLSELYSSTSKLIEEFGFVQMEKIYSLEPDKLIEDIKNKKEKIKDLEKELKSKEEGLVVLQSVIDRKNDELNKLGVFKIKEKNLLKEEIKTVTATHSRVTYEIKTLNEQIAEIRRFLYRFDKKNNKKED